MEVTAASQSQAEVIYDDMRLKKTTVLTVSSKEFAETKQSGTKFLCFPLLSMELFSMSLKLAPLRPGAAGHFYAASPWLRTLHASIL